MPAVELIALRHRAAVAAARGAARKRRFGAPLVEIYGCTEAGQVATRRTTAGAEWQTFAGVALQGDDERAWVSGGHVPEATRCATCWRCDADRFRLLGRTNDLVNIAGKRSSLAISTTSSTRSRAWSTARSGARRRQPTPPVTRLVAFVVAPGLGREQILAALRDRVDAAFLPRRIVPVDSLPREATGKLTAARLAELAAAHAAGGPRH